MKTKKIRVPAVTDSSAYALEITGNSMLPVYRKGDTIIVSPKAVLRKGDRVVVKTTNGKFKSCSGKQRSAASQGRSWNVLCNGIAKPDRNAGFFLVGKNVGREHNFLNYPINSKEETDIASSTHILLRALLS